ncbi:hypothetical protein [Endozoicomonas euniceicola]|uniref:Uncharacterized protein n=1 Tax=Endozoicomonas euniceicola TaxID=1234143 RepID=A0ABY6H1A2_9GAMM|nr:hypothetical protein [Endozoicomonas euniceicola]UYM18690.1 hypothetical protein NX720_12550 [Endozoicomonas euniceicola]
MATINNFQGAVAPVPGDSGRKDTGQISPEKASNPGRLNRSSIIRQRVGAIIRRATRSPSPPKQTPIQERKAEQLPAEAVKAQMSGPGAKASASSMESKLDKLGQDVQQFRANRQKAENKDSKPAHKQQIQQLKAELKAAKSLQKNAEAFARLEAGADYGFNKMPGEYVRQKAPNVLSEAQSAVKEAKQELSEAGAKLKAFKPDQHSGKADSKPENSSEIKQGSAKERMMAARAARNRNASPEAAFGRQLRDDMANNRLKP